MAYLKAAITMIRDVRSLVDCNHFQMRWFVFARFLLTSASRSPSAIAELLVYTVCDLMALCWSTGR